VLLVWGALDSVRPDSPEAAKDLAARRVRGFLTTCDELDSLAVSVSFLQVNQK
jgi:hypothetical protein